MLSTCRTRLRHTETHGWFGQWVNGSIGYLGWSSYVNQIILIDNVRIIRKKVRIIRICQIIPIPYLLPYSLDICLNQIRIYIRIRRILIIAYHILKNGFRCGFGAENIRTIYIQTWPFKEKKTVIGSGGLNGWLYSGMTSTKGLGGEKKPKLQSPGTVHCASFLPHSRNHGGDDGASDQT